MSRAAVIVAALRSGWVGERTDPRDGPDGPDGPDSSLVRGRPASVLRASALTR